MLNNDSISYNVYAIACIVSNIQCSFSSQGLAGIGDTITATLKRPNGFKGSPLFADDRSVNPQKDRSCSINPDEKDASNLTYKLRIVDFTKCGVLKRNVRHFSSICADNLTRFLFSNNIGFRTRSNMVSSISGCCHAIRSRAHYHV